MCGLSALDLFNAFVLMLTSLDSVLVEVARASLERIGPGCQDVMLSIRLAFDCDLCALSQLFPIACSPFPKQASDLIQAIAVLWVGI